MGGMVLETNISEIVAHVEAQNKLEKSETSPTMSIKVMNQSFWYVFIILLLVYCFFCS